MTKALWVLGLGLIAAAAVGLMMFLRPPASSPPLAALDAGITARERVRVEVAEVLFDGKWGPGWEDWGWGPHQTAGGGPARVQFGGYGGIILRHEEVTRTFGALVFQFKAPAEFGDFLEVSLSNKGGDKGTFPSVPIGQNDIVRLADGWSEVLVPWSRMNPSSSSFDRVAIKARRSVSADWVQLDKVVLTKPDGGERAVGLVRKRRLSVECGKPATPISPLIYGISYGDGTTGETAHRIGGNSMSRLNWELGAWNAGSDWFFENTTGSTGLWDWLDDSYQHGFKMALVVPMIGWVAKDGASVGFPVAQFGPQGAVDPQRPEAGNGLRATGEHLRPGAPTNTSIAASPETIQRWIQTLREKDKARGGRSVDMYILDNEPNLWHGTHRDVHPDPLTYDELLDRTIRYGSAVRRADPDAIIAGPAEWGWTAYFFSAKDTAETRLHSPDRREHGSIPLLPWYLDQLAQYEKRTGTRVLDVVDVHFYPQAPGVYGKDVRTDPETAALRLRSTRAFWDPDYRDESWIGERVSLIPRLKDWIQKNYPGRGISIGEWSFGAEGHISGGLAIAEVLGRFGQQGVRSAFFWGKPQPYTPSSQAFRAFRNFDGRNGRFLDWSVPTTEAEHVSLFASRDATTSHVVAIVLNLDPAFAADLEIALPGCGHVVSRRVFTYDASLPALSERVPHTVNDTSITEMLPPYSMDVIELTIQRDPG